MIGAGRRKVPRGVSARKSPMFAPRAVQTPGPSRNSAFCEAVRVAYEPSQMGPSRLFGATCEQIQKFRDGPGGPGGPAGRKSGIFGPKTRGGPCADLPRSFCIILSPQSRHPTMFVNDFHKQLSKKRSQQIMTIKLFEHPLKTRAHGTVSV